MEKHARGWIWDMSASPMYVKCCWLPVCWIITTFLELNQHQILPTRQYFSQLYGCLSMSCHSWLPVHLTITAFFEFLFYQILATKQYVLTFISEMPRCPSCDFVNEWMNKEIEDGYVPNWSHHCFTWAIRYNHWANSDTTRTYNLKKSFEVTRSRYVTLLSSNV